MACPNTSPAAPSASGCCTNSRLETERAMSAPVRRVLLPLKSSGPVGVAANHGSSSFAMRSKSSCGASRSTMTAPSEVTASATASAVVPAGRCAMGMPRSFGLVLAPRDH